MIFKAYVALLAIILVMIVPKAWDLRLLYTDSDVRAKTKAMMERESDARGWLLSDMSLRSITTDTAHVCYTPHFRGARGEECFNFSL